MVLKEWKMTKTSSFFLFFSFFFFFFSKMGVVDAFYSEKLKQKKWEHP